MSQAKSGENHPMFGQTHSADTLAKMSEAKFGKTHSDETLAKMCEAKIGENHPMKKMYLFIHLMKKQKRLDCIDPLILVKKLQNI
jgi:hypothetical protein